MPFLQMNGRQSAVGIVQDGIVDDYLAVEPHALIDPTVPIGRLPISFGVRNPVQRAEKFFMPAGGAIAIAGQDEREGLRSTIGQRVLPVLRRLSRWKIFASESGLSIVGESTEFGTG